MPARPDPSLLRGTTVRIVREYMGLTRGELADLLEVSFDSVRSWEGDRRGTPPGVIAQLHRLQDQLDQEAATALEHYLAEPDPAEGGPAPVLTIEEGPDRRPAGWQRHIAARVAQHRPDLVIEDNAHRERRAGG